MKWYYFLILIAIGTVVYLVVGYIGNKVVDGTENALRAKRLQKQNGNPAPPQSARRLADQLAPRAGAAQPQQTVQQPQQTVPQMQTQKAKFCAACGAPLAEQAKFCPMCGTPVEHYRSRV